ncbi:OLC1v1026917C1 [Oldenlandia corymbosa var. corymbosa]|uniref:OLC1v1026917C1 n=1 Tax=Oldenlandia corymbosa var. corymbosa TaxID=529605 RepID=A0AAV1CBG1_OLDCO|nr:OLC1v1026917C1 [Oldenlandia corymbosa var. corymbosa]
MGTSTLNPNAPMFVPLAYRAVEDFSDQWWDLVKSSPWFREFWIQEYCSDSADSLIEPVMYDDLDGFPDFPDDDVFSSNFSPENPKKVEQGKMDLISLGSLKWKKPRGPAEMGKHWDKAPKIVNVRVSPRPIKQPR